MSVNGGCTGAPQLDSNFNEPGRQSAPRTGRDLKIALARFGNRKAF
jgi:hypothetical protein